MGYIREHADTLDAGLRASATGEQLDMCHRAALVAGAGAGCGLLIAGCWLLVAGCWLLVAGCWLLVAGCWLLVAGCWLLGRPAPGTQPGGATR
jgi:hypothetical protein